MKLVVDNGAHFDATLDAAVSDVRERLAGHVGALVELLVQLDHCRKATPAHHRVAFLESLQFFSAALPLDESSVNCAIMCLEMLRRDLDLRRGRLIGIGTPAGK